MEDMTEVEDMTEMEDMTEIKGMKDDIKKDKENSTRTPVTCS
jgi:hypothetical protein